MIWIRTFIALLLLAPVFLVVQWLLGTVRRRRPRWRTDLCWWFVTPTLMKPAVRVATALVLVPFLLLFDLPRDDTLLAGHGPLAQLPRGVQFAMVLVLVDAVSYWMHRAHHRRPWLWRTHAVHHSSEHLDWLASVRVHPLNTWIQRVPSVVLAVLLGFDLTTIAATQPFLAAYALLLHSDVRLRLGPLRYLVVTPSYHRWHHARTGVPDGGCNFAGLLPVWDLAFGTFHLPDEEPEDFGVVGDGPDEGFFAQLVWPLRRDRVGRTGTGSQRPHGA